MEQLPNPTPYPKSRRVPLTVLGERNLECPRYASCLARAAVNDWPGFSCAHCSYRADTGNRLAVGIYAEDRRRGPP